MRRWKAPFKVHDNAHPLVRRLFNEMNAQRCCMGDLADRSGVHRDTLREWRTRTSPTIDNLDACLNALGLELTIRPRREVA